VRATSINYQGGIEHVSVCFSSLRGAFESDMRKILAIEGENLKSALCDIGAIYACFIEQHRLGGIEEVNDFLPLFILHKKDQLFLRYRYDLH
jgi:hypothetical protein